MQKSLTVFEVVVSQKRVVFFINQTDAEIMAQRLALEDVDNSDSIQVIGRDVTVEIIHGSLKGNVREGETPHVTFRFPSQKLSSQDVLPTDPSEFLATCRCQQCQKRYVLVKY